MTLRLSFTAALAGLLALGSLVAVAPPAQACIFSVYWVEVTTPQGTVGVQDCTGTPRPYVDGGGETGAYAWFATGAAWGHVEFDPRESEILTLCIESPGRAPMFCTSPSPTRGTST